MRELLIPTIISLPIATSLGLVTGDRNWQEHMLDKWGIAFVGLSFTVALASWLARRENKAEERRQKREDELEEQRQLRETLANEERLKLHMEIRDLNQQQLKQLKGHAETLEQLVKDGNKAQADVGIELKNIARKVQCHAKLP